MARQLPPGFLNRGLAASALGLGDRKWWPFWMREFVKSTGQANTIQITITVDSVFTFLRTLRDSDKPAFVRLQVVRSLIFYQKEVLQASTERNADKDFRASEPASTPSSGLSATLSLLCLSTPHRDFEPAILNRPALAIR